MKKNNIFLTLLSILALAVVTFIGLNIMPGATESALAAKDEAMLQTAELTEASTQTTASPLTMASSP